MIVNSRRAYLTADLCGQCAARWPSPRRGRAGWSRCPRCRRRAYRLGLRLAPPAVDTGHATPSPRDLAHRTP